MTQYAAAGSGRNEPSSDPINDSDEELFGSSSHRPHETVETVPISHHTFSSDSEDGHDTVATIPLRRTTQQLDQAATERITQPTQRIVSPGSDRSAMPRSSPPSQPFVQVTASSPLATPSNQRPRPRGFLANAMAPAGTAFRRPTFNPPAKVQKPIVIDDDDGPTYKGVSSDEDDVTANSIKPTNFARSKDSGYILESPAKNNTHFSSLMRGFSYDSSANNTAKRPPPVDDMASAYGKASKRSRQTVPSRIHQSSEPFQRPPSPDLQIGDIADVNERSKVKKMIPYLTNIRIKTMLYTLRVKKGYVDDAVDAILIQKEQREALRRQTDSIDLTVSDDELSVTPAVQKKTAPAFAAKQQAKDPHKSIADKWSSTQAAPKDRTKQLDAFSPPKPEVKNRKRLVRGRKDRSSPDLPDIAEGEARRTTHIGRKIVEGDDESDEGDNAAAKEDTPTDRTDSFEQRLFKWFNTCSAADLADTANIKPALAAHFVAQQPFRSIAAVQKVDDPDRKPTKSKAKRTPIGEKVWETVDEMITAYEAVDYLVKKCEAIAKPLAKEMKSWGVNTTGAGAGELEITTMSQSPAHDSGIGTPTGEEKVKRMQPKNYITQPSIMNFEYKLNDYQIVGMNWLNLLYKHGHGCILADDMGLGKTYQVIAFLSHLYMTGQHGPHLIVVPSATLENWLMEFKKFSPMLAVEPYYGTQAERAEMRYQLESSNDVNVIVTTYAIAKGKEDAPWLRSFGFTCTVFDEGHYLKNADSKLSRALNRIQSDFRVLLTGTPLQNNLKELMSLLGFMMPDLFVEKSDELEAIFTHHVKTMDENHAALLSAQRIARARSMLTPFILRRKKSQVIQLPPKVRRVEFCDLTAEQSEIYQMWYNKAVDIRARREAGVECVKDTTFILMKLRQAAIHSILFRRSYPDTILPKIAKMCLKDEQWALSSPELIVTELEHYSDMEIHTLCAKNPVLNKFALKNDEWLASGKVQKMLELLRTFMAEGSRTLIFSQFVMVLDILELVLNHKMIKYFRLDGSTKVSERQDLINTFSEQGNDTPVFLLSTKAGGAGINLAAANKVIVFDSGFNPQDDVQAENRAHRIGQEKPVEVVRLVTKGTVEEAIYKMGLTKVELDQRVAGTASGMVTPPEEAEDVEGKKGQNEAEKQGQEMVENLFFQNIEAGDGKNMANVAPEANGEAHSDTKADSQMTAVEQMASLDVKKEATGDAASPPHDSDCEEGREAQAPEDEEVLTARPKRVAATAQRSSSQVSSASTSRSSRSRKPRVV